MAKARAIRTIGIRKYADVNMLVQLTNGRNVETMAQQFAEVFQRRLLRKYSRLYAQANAISNPRQRRRRLRQIRRMLQIDGERLFDQYQLKSLDTLADAGLEVKRRELQLLESADDLAKNRKAIKARRLTDADKLRGRAERRQLQLGTGLKPKQDPRKVYYRHRGSRGLVDNRLLDYIHREGKKVGRTINQAQYTRRITPKAKTVARTTAQGALADADQQAIRESFPRLRYVSVLDTKTTPRCRWLNGKVFKANTRAVIRPPQHFNCRAWLTPVSRNKQRDGYFAKAIQTPFPTWLKRQTPHLQKLIVGKSNYKSYKAGRYVPPPRWSATHRFYADKKTGMPVVTVKDNLARIRRRTQMIGVRF